MLEVVPRIRSLHLPSPSIACRRHREFPRRSYAKRFHPKDEVSLMETLLRQSSWGIIHPVEAMFEP